jgi:hypothetical protein
VRNETAKGGEQICKEKSVSELSVIIIIIIIIISFMQGIRTYIPETNHVSRAHSVAAIPCAHGNGAYSAVFNIELLCASTLALSAVCALCPI